MGQLQTPPATRLSAIDAFFVAYQQRAGILMQLGGELDLGGELRREDLERMLLRLVARWPRLGQTLKRNLLGLEWRGKCQPEKMLHLANGKGALTQWRNQPLDPFQEPPFQVMWWPQGTRRGTIAFRAHHAVMDGESFVSVTATATEFLLQSHSATQDSERAEAFRLADLVSLKQLVKRRRLRGMWRYARTLAHEARAGRSARLAVTARAPGNTQTCERRLDREQFGIVKRQAAAAQVAPVWFCAGAWLRAIHRWNVSQGLSANPLLSLEFPVSLRRGRKRAQTAAAPGNFISPLVLFAEANQPLVQIANQLRRQLLKEVSSQSHWGTPILTAPAKFLPWAWFQRVALNSRTTGFATTHFSWFQQADVLADLSNRSAGALRLLDQRIYTPVCLDMGAAVAVLVSGNGAQLFLSYRVTALSAAAAEALLDLLVTELGCVTRAEKMG